jgi:anti-sigma regulatory factor (Ser/Thr protein kinase)
LASEYPDGGERTVWFGARLGTGSPAKAWFMIEMNLTLDTNEEAPRISRQRLSEIRSEIEPRYEDLALVISELVSNSVRHSGEGTVSVTVRKQANRVRLEVRDPGPGFDPDRPAGDGMGLKIVNRVADAWGIENDGDCTVWVEVALTATT